MPAGMKQDMMQKQPFADVRQSVWNMFKVNDKGTRTTPME